MSEVAPGEQLAEGVGRWQRAAQAMTEESERLAEQRRAAEEAAPATVPAEEVELQ